MGREYNPEKDLLDKVKGTTADLKKPENLTNIHNRMNANRNKFEKIIKKKHFQEQNSKTLTDLKNECEKWKNDLSEADQKTDKCKEITFFLKKIVESREDIQASPEVESSKKPAPETKDLHQESNDSKERVEKSSSTDLKRNQNPHRKPSTTSHTSSGVDVNSLKKELKREIKNLEEKLLNSVAPVSRQSETVLSGVMKIDKTLKNLADDIVYGINKSNKDNPSSSNIEEALDVLPAINRTLKEVAEKLKTVGTQKTISIPSDIPEDEKAILELSRFMKDGLEQFENIARYHISKQHDLDKAEKKADNMDKELDNAKNEAYEQGKSDGHRGLVKTIFEKFPTEFENIKAAFGDIVVEKNIIGTQISVNADNRQELEREIGGIDGEGEYIIESSTLMIGDEVLKQATIKKANE